MDFDPVLLAVISNRLTSICREMEKTILRSGRSAVLNMARGRCALSLRVTGSCWRLRRESQYTSWASRH